MVMFGYASGKIVNFPHFDMLEPLRSDEIENIIWHKQGRTMAIGSCGGYRIDPVTKRSIAFTVEMGDSFPYVVLSAERHTKVSRREAQRFFEFMGVDVLREPRPQTKGTIARHFEIAPKDKRR